MADDPERPLKTLMLDLLVEMKELKLQLRRIEEDAERRHIFVMSILDPNGGEDCDRVEAPEDIAGPLKEFLKRR